MRPNATLLLGVVLLGGCGDDPKIELPALEESATTEPELDAGFAQCDQAKDGTFCGLGKHCLFNACVENACGDGIPAESEACDDANERDHDGCDSRCRIEVEPGCGNGVREPGEECDDGGSSTCTSSCTEVACGDGIVNAPEECDDGNLTSGDSCASDCTREPQLCGNRKLDPGEECDDGNVLGGDDCEFNCTLPLDAGVDSGPAVDAGDAPEDAGLADAGADAGDLGDADAGRVDAGTHAADAGTIDAGTPAPRGVASEVPGCAACRDQNCRTYQGLPDLLMTCFENADPHFVQKCVDLLDCAYLHDCGYNLTGLPECFCGTADIAACQSAGAANGPCQEESYAAADTNSLAVLGGAFGDLSLPVGVANYLLECDREACASCAP